MATNNGEGARARRSTRASRQLAALRERRAQLDADQADRKRCEDAALTRLAEHIAAVDDVITVRDRRIATRQRRIEAHRDAIEREHSHAEQRITHAQTRVAPVLAELSALGRSHQDIAALARIQVKTVSRLIRQQHHTNTAPTPPEPTWPVSTPATPRKPGDCVESAADHDADGLEPPHT